MGSQDVRLAMTTLGSRRATAAIIFLVYLVLAVWIILEIGTPWLGLAGADLPASIIVPVFLFSFLSVVGLGVAIFPLIEDSQSNATEKNRLARAMPGIVISLGSLAGVWYLSPDREEPTQPIVWAQVRPDDAKGNTADQLIARTIVPPDHECPAITIGGKTVAMSSRNNPAYPEFPSTVCEAAYDGAQRAKIGDVELRERPTAPRRILVIGDTGCRIAHYPNQNCNDPKKWPFRTIANAAASKKPDLIIHVGDYHYREKPCADREGCSGSPFGDNWRTWKADFFDPAANLLPAAPWIMLRGNHENCSRAGSGWLFLLSPQLGDKLPHKCVDDTEPYVLEFDNLHLVIFDTAAAEDDYRRSARVAKYRTQMRNIALPNNKRESWLLLHQPLWVNYGINGDKKDLYESAAREPLDDELRKALCEKIISPINTFRQWITNKVPNENPNKPNDEMPCSKAVASTKALPPPGFSLVVSGDTHTFQLFAPKDATRPSQLVVGNSGDVMENDDNYPNAREELETDDKAELFGASGTLWMRHVFGFVMLEKPPGASDWTATLHNVNGKVVETCNLKRSGSGCRKS